MNNIKSEFQVVTDTKKSDSEEPMDDSTPQVKKSSPAKKSKSDEAKTESKTESVRIYKMNFSYMK